MKIFLPLFILVCIIANFSQTAKVTAPTAQIRAEPNIKAKILRSVKVGDLLEIKYESHKNGWYAVDIGDYEQGWILDSKVKIISKGDGGFLDNLKEITGDNKGWYAYAHSKTSSYYYNALKIKHNLDIYQVWTQERDTESSEVLTTTFYEIDCSTEKLRSLAGTDYASGRGWDSPNEKFTVIFPDSIGEGLYNKICGK